MSKDSIYDQLVQRAQTKKPSSSSSSSGGSRAFQFRGPSKSTSSSSGGRFSGTSRTTASKKTTTQQRVREAEDRPVAVPVQREKRIIAADPSDRDLAYQPPVSRPEQAVAWQPPTFWQIMEDLGLRVIEVGIASIAQEIAYFFTHRRLLPRHMKRTH